MMKLAVLVLLVGAAAASGIVDVSSQSAVIDHVTPHGYRDGVSARYFDKVENRGLYGLLGYYDGLAYGGPYYNGLAYGGPYYNGLAYNGIDNLGLGYRGLGYGLGGLGYLV